MCRYCWAWRIPLYSKRIQSGRYSPLTEAKKIAEKCTNGERVVISFTSDPYPPQEAWLNYTRSVISILRHNGCPTILVLTKNPILALKDQDVMLTPIAGHSCNPEVWLGTTITSSDTGTPYSIILEPNAPRTHIRLMALKTYQEQGGKVWLSLEPIIPIPRPPFYPENIVKTALSALDPENIALVVLGRLNYINQLRTHMPMPLPSEERITRFYREHVPIAIEILEQYEIPYHVKKELKEVLE